MDPRMPDEMNEHQSIMEMLPEEMPEVDVPRNPMCNETMGIREYTCAECGRVFIAYSEHKYRRDGKPGVRMYCSHRCFRVIEKQEEEAYRQRMLGAWVPGDNRKTKSKRNRVKECEKKLAEAEAKKTEPGWAEMTYGRRRQALKRIAYWQAQLLIAEQELEEEQEHDD